MKTSFLIFGLICISGTLLAEIEVRFTRLTPEMLDSGKLPFQLMAFGPIGGRAKIKTVPMPNTKERFNRSSIILMTKPASQIDLPNQYYHHELRSKEEHPADSVLSSQVDFAFVVVDTDFERSDPKWGERTVVNLYFCPLSELLNK